VKYKTEVLGQGLFCKKCKAEATTPEPHRLISVETKPTKNFKYKINILCEKERRILGSIEFNDAYPQFSQIADVLSGYNISMKGKKIDD